MGIGAFVVALNMFLTVVATSVFALRYRHNARLRANTAAFLVMWSMIAALIITVYFFPGSFELVSRGGVARNIFLIGIFLYPAICLAIAYLSIREKAQAAQS